MSIAGIDIGTTGCKCSVYSKEGVFINEAYQEYNIVKNSGQHELDMEMVWNCVLEVVKRACKGAKELQAIGITSFGEVFVMTDIEGKPLRPAMLYTDSRGEGECEKLRKQFGDRKLSEITGVKLHKMMSVSRIMWIKQNDPEAFEKAEFIFLIADYFTYRLCKNALIDYSLAARTAMFDIKRLDWNDEILGFVGVDRKKLPKPVKTGTIAGRMRTELAIELGLPASVEIDIGCHDQIAAAIGSGVLSPGMAADGAGTVECITPCFRKLSEEKVFYQGGYALIPYVVSGAYVTYAFSFTGGALLKWYRDKLCALEYQLSLQRGENIYDKLNEGVKEEPGDLLVLPHFSGAGTPYMDAASKGAIIGLTTETDSLEIYKALMEAVAYEMRINVEELNKSGILINHLHATGGGAKSSIWLQMKADILNLPITSLASTQAGTLGCIMLAGVACGIYKDLEEAGKIFVKTETTYYPREIMSRKYSEHYEKYKKLYTVISEVLKA